VPPAVQVNLYDPTESSMAASESSFISQSCTAKNSPSIAVIGGGITGLVALREIRRRNPHAQVQLFEASSRVGGVLQTTRVDSWLVEHSADMMATQPQDGWALCEELGLTEEMLPTNREHRGALVYRGGRLYPVPDESFESFALRRCGREAYESLIQPLVSGIYTADPARLSMQATALARFVKMEQTYGSLMRGMLKGESKRQGADHKATGARYSMFVAPRLGMQQLVDRLADDVGREYLSLQTPIESMRRGADPDGWELDFGDRVQRFDRVVLATSAPRASQLLVKVDSQLSAQIAGIEHASSAVVVLAFPKPSRNPGVFGLVVPNAEKRQMIAASFGSNKFPGRAPKGGLLVRVFLGGALNEAVTLQPDDALIELALRELKEIANVSGSVAFSQVVHWQKTMPQYHVGHLQKLESIQQRLAQLPGLVIAGNAYQGVGIPDCTRAGRQAAEQICSA
jgi:oxygen-dependent protoporphyrinogen oxidase